MRLRLAVCTTAALAAPALAQDLTLDKFGGAVAGPTEFAIHGLPGEPYALLLDLSETPTFIPGLGLQLEISDQFAWLTFAVPGFFGLLDGSGDVTASMLMHSDPGIADHVFSLQAVSGFGPFRASNLVRVTPQVSGTFKPALNSPSVPIVGGGAAIAPNNELIFVGGSGPVAQRYESRTEEWQLSGASFGVGLLAQSTPLSDGRVLFTGGLDLTTGQPTDAAGIYDPATQSTTTLTMAAARAGHGTSQLGNGLVLITGGFSSYDLSNPLTLFSGILGSTELFDPATNTFSAGPGLLEPRAMHTSTTLTDGQALIAGGITLIPFINVPTVSSNAYRYNPSSGSFGLPAFFQGARFLHSAAALDDGRVLIAGGLSLDFAPFLASGDITDIVIGTRDDCVRYNQGLFGFGSFDTIAGMQVGRAGPAIAPLPGGGALIAGGFQLAIDVSTQNFVATATETADVFSSSPNTIAPTGSMAAPRLFPITASLSDGTILVVGGGPAEAEIFQ